MRIANQVPAPLAAPAGTSASSSSRSASGTAAIPLAALLAAFLLLQRLALLPTASDEGIYFYQALRISQGRLPYREIFMAHPPLHAAPLVLLFKLAGGYHPVLAKLPALLAGVLATVLTFAITGRLSPTLSARARGAAALVSAALLTSSYLFLECAGHDTGMTQALALLALSGCAALAGRAMLSGLSLAASVMTTLATLPTAAALGAALLTSMPSSFRVRFACAFAAGLGVVVGLGLLIGGAHFFDQVFGYHLAKRPLASAAGPLSDVILADWPLFVTALWGFAVSWVSGARWRRVGLGLFVAVALQTAAAVARPGTLLYYFLPAFLPAAVLGGIATGLLVQQLCSSAATCAPVAPSRRTKRRFVLLALGLGCALVVVASAGTASFPVAAGRFVRARRASLDTLPAMRAAIIALANRHPDTALFGDSGTVPQLALSTGVPVLGDQPDTNAQRVKSGQASIADFISLLESHPHAVVLVSPQMGIGSFRALQEYLADRFVEVRRFESRSGARHVLLRRRS